VDLREFGQQVVMDVSELVPAWDVSMLLSGTGWPDGASMGNLRRSGYCRAC
jgi:hypothetical protein